MFGDAKNVFPREKKNLHSPIYGDGVYGTLHKNVKEFH
jgi:hypothetical protein